jgi:hypothetical protein
MPDAMSPDPEVVALAEAMCGWPNVCPDHSTMAARAVLALHAAGYRVVAERVCVRYFGRDGTFCATHRAPFDPPTDTQCVAVRHLPPIPAPTEQEARTLARAEVIAALPDAIERVLDDITYVDFYHGDSGDDPTSSQPAFTAAVLAAALSRLGERE